MILIWNMTNDIFLNQLKIRTHSYGMPVRRWWIQFSTERYSLTGIEEIHNPFDV